VLADHSTGAKAASTRTSVLGGGAAEIAGRVAAETDELPQRAADVDGLLHP